MVYTHKSPALLVIGIVILAWGWLNQTGAMDGIQAWLQPGAYKEQKQAVEKHQAAEKAAVEKAAAEGKPAPEAKAMKPGKFDAVKAKQAQLAYIVGGIFTLFGLLIMVWKPKEGNLDYFTSIVPGIAFIVVIAFGGRWMLGPIGGNWGKAAEPTLGWNFARIFNLNYVVLGIVIGILIVNLLRIPAWAANGVRTAREVKFVDIGKNTNGEGSSLDRY